jgi:UDP-glucose 4-epimerase
VTRFLITGGAGLVGSHLADLLLQDPDARVTVVDDFSRGRVENLARARATHRLEVVTGDVRDRALLDRHIPGVDVVFHQAAIRITQCAVDPRLAFDVLATGTFEVLEAAAAAGVRKVVVASSASIYGMADVFPTPESCPPYANDTIYGAAKLFGEGLLESFRAMRGLDGVVLRYFSVYGPRMDAHGAYTEVLVRWIDRIERGLSPVIFGDGLTSMDFVYAEDVARANVLAARVDTASRIFNIGSGVETSLRDLARMLIDVMDAAPRSIEFAEERKVNAVRRRVADIRAAREQLGFKATVPLAEGLRRLVAWYRTEIADGRLV